MLNNDLKKKAIQEYEKAYKQYESLTKLIEEDSKKLFEMRSIESHQLILKVEQLFFQIANKPKEFDKTFIEYKAEFNDFNHILDEIKKQSADIDIKAGGSAAAGVAAGAGVASLAPTAAMAIATTFGTASTGTAISSLSGAAATNAALAWLGGGTLSAGGGGMAAGRFLLKLAGPTGWAISGVALVGSALFARNHNKKLAIEATEKTKELIVLNKQFETASKELTVLLDETKQHIEGMNMLLNTLDSTLKTFDYYKMNSYQKELLIAIKNHVESLSKLIKKKIVL